jgi:fatty acid synthase subunit alpha
VELGPAKTLVGMAQKTRDMKLGTGEMPIDFDMQLLASTQNAKELCYEYEPAASSSQASSEDITPPISSMEVPMTPQLSQQPQIPASACLPVAAASIADVSISAEDIVRALVAQKLMKEMEHIPFGKSIKTLSGGELKEFY